MIAGSCTPAKAGAARELDRTANSQWAAGDDPNPLVHPVEHTETASAARLRHASLPRTYSTISSTTTNTE